MANLRVSSLTMRFFSGNLIIAAAALMLAAGCSKTDGPQEPPVEPAKAPVVAAPDVEAYRLDVKNWEGPTGEEGYVVVAVDALNGHKINEKYPHKVVIDDAPSGLKLPLQKMTKDDAELDGTKRITYSIPIVGEKAGEYTVNATVKLSVCNDDQCIIQKEKIAARVVAQ